MFSPTYTPWIIGIFVFFIVVSLLAVTFLLIKANASGQESDSAEDELADKTLKNKRFDSFVQLRQSFIGATEFLKKRVPGRNFRYQVPWFLMIGEASSGKSTILSNNGMGVPTGGFQDDLLDQDQGIQWWFYDDGVVLEPKGDFVLKANGRSSNETGWHNTIKLLKRFRPKRPIDGVIVTIPASDVFWGETQDQDRKERINLKSSILYNKLWELENELGIHFPVYIVITKCDHIDGFASYCSETPQHLRTNLMGWSNPYSLDVSYSANWVEEAINSVHTGIFQSQMELFAVKQDIVKPDSLYLFPTNFKKILEPTRIYLNTLFKKSAFHKSFFFRGLFFTGSEDIEESALKKPSFLRHLFEKKVFPEGGLAKIVDQALLSKHRALRAVQIIFVLVLLICGGGLLNAALNLRQENRTMLPVLNLIGDSLVELKYKKTVDRSLFEKKGLSLLNGMSNIDPSRLISVFIPSSWPSELQSKIVSSMTVAYEKIIMRMMFIELNNHVRSTGFVEKKVEKREENINSENVTLEKTPEFIKLLSFIKSLEELEKNIATYNNQLVTGSANSREFVQVVAYLYGIDLKGNVSQEALAKLSGNPVGVEILKSNVNAKTWELTRQFYDRIFKDNQLNQKLVKIGDILQNIHREEQVGEENIVVRFQNLLSMLNQIEKDLARSEFAWMTGPNLDLGNKFEQILESIQNSGFLGQSVYLEIKKRGERDFKRLKEELFEHQTRLTGSLLRKDNGRVLLEFSPKVMTLKKALKDFFRMKFADIDNTQSKMLVTLSKNQRIVWNTQLLEQAVKLYDPYNQFMTERLNNFPRELQPIFEQVARESLETNMVDLIARAQELENIPKVANPSFRKETLRSEVLNFKESSKHIAKLLDIFDRLELHKTNRNLFRVVAVQGNRTLAEIDQMLREDDLYMSRDGGFSWWSGDRSPMLAAYNVNDIDELKLYFATQQDRIRFLTSEYASPLVNLLGYKNKNRGYVIVWLVKKWERIIKSFEMFEKKKPGNSINTLEKFILTGINEISAKHCSKEIPTRILSARSGDYFLNQRNRLRKKLYLRCQKLSFEKDLKEF